MNFLTLILRYGSIAAAIFGVVAIVLVSQSQAEKQMLPPGDPPIMPPQKPYAEAVAATGILEALSDNVAIGVPLPGLVTEVLVKVNDTIKFEINPRAAHDAGLKLSSALLDLAIRLVN